MHIVIPTWLLRVIGALLLLLGAAGAFGAYRAHQYLYASAGQINNASISRAQLLDVLIAERFATKGEASHAPATAPAK